MGWIYPIEIAIINRAELSDTHVQLLLNDTTATPKDTTQSEVRWKVDLRHLKLKNVSFSMQLPADSMRLAAHVGEAQVNDAEADLKNLHYGLRSFLVSGTSVNYDVGTADRRKVSILHTSLCAIFVSDSIRCIIADAI